MQLQQPQSLALETAKLGLPLKQSSLFLQGTYALAPNWLCVVRLRMADD